MKIGLIPMRSGSERVPNKNLRPLDGKPLFEYTLDVALRSNLDKVIIATDYPKDTFKGYEVHSKFEYYERSKVPSNQKAVTYIDEVIANNGIYEEDVICLLQPTCPIRTVGDVNRALLLYHLSYKETLVSVVRLEGAQKLYNDGVAAIPENDDMYVRLNPNKKRYLHMRNSSIYIFNVGCFHRNDSIFEEYPTIYEMPAYKSVDINTEEDWEHAKLIVRGGFKHV